VIDPAAVAWGGAATGLGTIVLLHGYGSNERELLNQVLRVLPEFALASLRGPVTEGPGNGWVSLNRSLTDLDPGAISALADGVSAGVMAWLDGAQHREPVGLLGVSQGGVLALHLLRRAPERFSFAVNLSGYVLAGRVAGDEILERNHPPVFWGRGTRDELVRAADVERTSAWLARHSTATIRTYDLEHAESEAEYGDVAAFVRSVAEGPSQRHLATRPVP